MTEIQPASGVADMGGDSGWGQAPIIDPDEAVFPEKWEGRAFALALLSMRLSGSNLDAFRHAMNRLDRERYIDDGYYGRWLYGAENLLLDSAIIAPGAVEARAANIAGGDVDEQPAPESTKPDSSPTAAGSIRELEA
ncbi:MAG: nitrile hydratase subunit beta, partial [Candidatus Nanopelagicales bacterium]